MSNTYVLQNLLTNCERKLSLRNIVTLPITNLFLSAIFRITDTVSEALKRKKFARSITIRCRKFFEQREFVRPKVTMIKLHICSGRISLETRDCKF